MCLTWRPFPVNGIGPVAGEGILLGVLGEASQENPQVATRLRQFVLVIRPLLITSVVLAVMMLVLVGSLLIYGKTHGPTTFRGVHAAGIDLGGLTVAEAEQKITQRFTAYSAARVQLVSGGQRWDLPLNDLSLTFDPQATAENAYNFGRSGNLWADSGAWLVSLLRGYTVSSAMTVNDAAVIDWLQRIAPSVTWPARDANYAFGNDGSLKIDPGAPGIGIDVSASLQRIKADIASLSTEGTTLAVISVPQAITQEQLEPGLEKADAMLGEPLVLQHKGVRWEVAPEVLRGMLILNPGSRNSKAVVALDGDALSAYLGSLADQIQISARNASVVWSGGKFVVRPSVRGETLDAHETSAEVISALSDGKHAVDVRVQTASPAIIDADAEDARRRAQEYVAKPFQLTWTGGNAEVAPADLANAVKFTEQPDENPKLAVDIDPAELGTVLKTAAKKAEVPMKNADLRYYDGAVKVVSPEQAGITIDLDQSTNAMMTALKSGKRTAEVARKDVQPEVTAAMASSVVIPDTLTSAETSYAGSVANRKFNVELAVSRVNGALIPPGGTFSFTGAVGAVDTEHGYKVGYGIVGASNGSVSTVPSVGGGICQVSTTAFQSVFWSGMPIVERNWHFYWIPLYGQPPSGLTGLDATVDTDVGLDFKFKNTTPNWLAVVASADGSTVRVELKGTNTGWNVHVDDPVVTNRVNADTKMVTRESSQLPAGSSVLVEHAEDGFDVAIRRVVSNGDSVLDDVTLRSHYAPSANVTLVGTG